MNRRESIHREWKFIDSFWSKSDIFKEVRRNQVKIETEFSERNFTLKCVEPKEKTPRKLKSIQLTVKVSQNNRLQLHYLLLPFRSSRIGLSLTISRFDLWLWCLHIRWTWTRIDYLWMENWNEMKLEKFVDFSIRVKSKVSYGKEEEYLIDIFEISNWHQFWIKMAADMRW